jgi:hypothetical protein
VVVARRRFRTITGNFRGVSNMQRLINQYRSGKVGYILLWLLGVPIPILLLLFLLRGCT